MILVLTKSRLCACALYKRTFNLCINAFKLDRTNDGVPNPNYKQVYVEEEDEIEEEDEESIEESDEPVQIFKLGGGQ